jgi:NTE family protein
MGGVQKLYKRQMPFVGIYETQIISSSTSSALLGMQYNFAGNFFLTGKVNTGIYDFTTKDKLFDSEKVQFINGLSLSLGYNFDLLPMEITSMYSPEIGAFYTHIKIGVLF